MSESNRIEDFYPSIKKTELSNVEARFLYFYHPGGKEKRITEGNPKEAIKLEKALRRERADCLDAIERHKLREGVVDAIVFREIGAYNYLRGRLNDSTGFDIPGSDPNLASITHKVLCQEDILLRLDKLGVLDKYRVELEKKYPSLKARFAELHKVKPAEKTAVVEKVIEPVVAIPPPPIAEKPMVKPVPKPPEFVEAWEKMPSAVQLNAELATELEKCGEEVKKLVVSITKATAERAEEVQFNLRRKIPRINFKRSVEAIWRNKRVRSTALLLAYASGTAGFVNSPQGRQFWQELVSGVPAIISSVSSETALKLADFQAWTEKNFRTNATSPIELPNEIFSDPLVQQEISATGDRKSGVAGVIAPEIPVSPEDLIRNFREAQHPELPLGFQWVNCPPESDYDQYVIPGYKPKSGSPYLKGLDYGRFPGAGVGDVWSVEDLSRIPADANAKNVRTVITSVNDIPRLEDLVKTATTKGISVAVQYSTPELPSDKDGFRSGVRRILGTAPAFLQFENEMGWLDEKGNPNQYYSGSHESIYRDYPAYVKILQEEIVSSGNKTKLVIGSLGWPFLANNSKMDRLFKGLIEAGVDVNSVYFDIHVFDHIEGQWEAQTTIARVKKLAELNGVSPHYLALEMYIGSDEAQTPQYVGRAFDVYKKLGLELVIAYPVSSSWYK